MSTEGGAGCNSTADEEVPSVGDDDSPGPVEDDDSGGVSEDCLVTSAL